MAASCTHAATIADVVPEALDVCPACVARADEWVHLRFCLACGHVGCCDDSPNRHARAHWRETGHPVMQSLEPGETWRWCFADEVALPAARAPFRR